MKRLIICIAVLFVGLLTSCEKKNATVSAPQESDSASKPLEVPKVDLSTPEKAIYSYQAVTNWKHAKFWEIVINPRGPLQDQFSKINEQLDKVTKPLYQDRIVQIFKQNSEIHIIDPADVYEFTIDEMKKETDTRVIAIIRVHNITPIPAGAVPDEIVLKMRKEGELYRIALELENARWLISDISELNKYSKEWSPSITKSTPTPRIPYLVTLP